MSTRYCTYCTSPCKLSSHTTSEDSCLCLIRRNKCVSRLSSLSLVTSAVSSIASTTHYIYPINRQEPLTALECFIFQKMGLHASKIDWSDAVAVEKSQPCDDGQSRATATTEDSSVRVSSPRSGAGPKRAPANRSRLSHQTWRSGSRSAPSFSQAPRSRHLSHTMENSAVPSLLRRDSDPGAPNEKRSSVPVKCPPRQRNNVAGHNFGATLNASSPIEGEDSTYLMKMYDTRTWEMYRRITEARKNSSYASNNTANAKFDITTSGDSTAEWENLQHDYSDSEGGHEMVFLFDFD